MCIVNEGNIYLSIIYQHFHKFNTNSEKIYTQCGYEKVRKISRTELSPLAQAVDKTMVT